MHNLNETEIEILVDALNISLASNKRMQKSKPKFTSIFEKIEADILALKIKLQSAPKPNK